MQSAAWGFRSEASVVQPHSVPGRLGLEVVAAAMSGGTGSEAGVPILMLARGVDGMCPLRSGAAAMGQGVTLGAHWQISGARMAWEGGRTMHYTVTANSDAEFTVYRPCSPV